MRLLVWAQVPRDQGPRTCTRDHVERQLEGGHLHAKEGGLGGNQPCWPWLNPTWILDFPATETVNNKFAV